MPRAGLYNRSYLRLVVSRPGHQSYVWTPGDTYHGYQDGESIHIHNFPDLVVGDKLKDKGTGFVYKVNALVAGDNEWISFVQFVEVVAGGAS